MSLKKITIRKHCRGMTLIECLVVLFILGLSVSFVAPNIADSLRRYSLRELNQQIIHLLYATQNAAVRNGKPSTLIIDQSASTIRLESKQNKSKINIPSNVSLKATGKAEANGAISITFFPDGTSTGGQVRLGNQQHSIVIDINWLTGRIISENVT